VEAGFDDAGWRLLDVPHDWSIEGPFGEEHPAGAGGGTLHGGIGWYRKTFSVAEADSSRLVFVDFDGVYQNSDVWLNGQHLGNRPYGYSSFRYELTPHLRYGTAGNVIAVRVDNSRQPNSRWYSGSGVHRHVRLVQTGRVHVDRWGTYVTSPEVSDTSARLAVRTTVRNSSPADRTVMLRTTLYDAESRESSAYRIGASAGARFGFRDQPRTGSERADALVNRSTLPVPRGVTSGMRRRAVRRLLGALGAAVNTRADRGASRPAIQWQGTGHRPGPTSARRDHVVGQRRRIGHYNSADRTEPLTRFPGGRNVFCQHLHAPMVAVVPCRAHTHGSSWPGDDSGRIAGRQRAFRES
jgi:hypothetical protein